MCEGNSCHHDGHTGNMSCCCGGFHRRFSTKKERLARFEEYRQDLLDEIKAVEEAMKELKK